MDNDERKERIHKLIDTCIDCGGCTKNCLLLTEIDESPITIAQRGATVEEAFGCSLCKLCEAVCPLDLSPWAIFEEKRFEAVAREEIDIQEYRYLFPDRPLNVLSFYRQYFGIDYDDLNQSSPGSTAFFPGCTLMTYSPGLTRKVYETLQNNDPSLVLMTDCCGKPLYQLGLGNRVEKNRELLKKKLSQLGVKRLVTACPNCYYELKKALADQEIEIVTIYEVLKELGTVKEQGHTPPGNALGNNVHGDNFQGDTEDSRGKVTIHDSCPDRFEGVFGSQVRQALVDAGYEIVEMKHKGKRSICCGSGGQTSHFRPDFAGELVNLRLTEAQKTETDTMITYCLSCALNIGRNTSDLKVKHVLNVLLDCEVDYDGVKDKAGLMFEGEEGNENWLRVMEEPKEENE